MLLGEILHKNVISPDLQGRETEPAVDELLRLLVDSGSLPPHLVQSARQAVLDRERTASTGMEMGIALPHGTIPRLDRLVGAMGLSREGVDFGCLDGQPAHIVLLLLLPRDQFHVQVHTLGAMASLLSDEDFRASLLASKDAESIMRLIKGGEQRPSFFSRFRRKS